MFNTYTEWLSGAAIGSLALVKFAPDFSIVQSYILTGFTIFLLEWLIWVVYAVILYPRFISPLRHLPTAPGGSLLMGQWKKIRAEPSGIPQREWLNTIPNDGLIRYTFMANKERILLTNPKALAEVLQTKSYQFIKPPQIRFGLIRLLGEGILLAEGAEHKAQRKHLNPAFSFRHTKDLYPIFWNKALELNKKLEQHLDESKDNLIEVGSWVSRATLDIIGLAGMGKDFDTLEHPGNELSKAYNTILTPTRQAQILALMGFFLPSWLVAALPVKRNGELVNASNTARQTARDLIKHKKMQMEKTKGHTDVDIISVALESGYFSEEDLVNQMMTFLLAGHETTSTSMQWAIYALCLHPTMQTKLRTEIHSSLSPTTQPLTAEVLDSLPFLHAFCQEVLRFHAPVAMTLRYATTDTTILDNFIPKGTNIIICPWAINYSVDLWGEDADQFKPERWLDPTTGRPNKEGGAKSNYAFLTFNHGVRSCIGQGFAVAEFKTLVASWVAQWDTKMNNPEEVLEIKGGVTSKPKGGMNVRISKVEWE